MVSRICPTQNGPNYDPVAKFLSSRVKKAAPPRLRTSRMAKEKSGSGAPGRVQYLDAYLRPSFAIGQLTNLEGKFLVNSVSTSSSKLLMLVFDAKRITRDRKII
jgi:hypothetical protein